jgi:predicted phosphodiesterase
VFTLPDYHPPHRKKYKSKHCNTIATAILSYKVLSMRLAILSDIHGNPIALNAVLADIQIQGEIDAYWILGDFSAIGYDPVTPLQQVVKLPNVRFVRGNTDRYVVTGEIPLNQEKVRRVDALRRTGNRECSGIDFINVHIS